MLHRISTKVAAAIAKVTVGWCFAIVVAFTGMLSLTLTGVVISRNEITVGRTQISVDDGNTKSFEATTYKIKSVKEARVLMKILQQPRNKQDDYCSADARPNRRTENRKAAPSMESNFRFVHRISTKVAAAIAKVTVGWYRRHFGSVHWNAKPNLNWCGDIQERNHCWTRP